MNESRRALFLTGAIKYFHVSISYLSHAAFALQVKLLEDQAKDLGKQIVDGCSLGLLCSQILLDPGSHSHITFS